MEIKTGFLMILKGEPHNATLPCLSLPHSRVPRDWVAIGSSNRIEAALSLAAGLRARLAGSLSSSSTPKSSFAPGCFSSCSVAAGRTEAVRLGVGMGTEDHILVCQVFFLQSVTLLTGKLSLTLVLESHQ